MIMRYADQAREIREAREAGIRALNTLRRAQKELEKARTWGVLDLLGGGPISGIVKHSKLGRAREYLEDARRDLSEFHRELADVDMPGVQVDSLLTFADFFCDSFLADFLVQRRINEARAQVERACNQVEAILRRLPTA